MASDNSLCIKLLNVKDTVVENDYFFTIQMALSIFESKSDHMLSTKIIARSVIAHVPDMTTDEYDSLMARPGLGRRPGRSRRFHS
ncbi:MAG: hypothetical protein IKE69_12230 [Thermoguttaceae bacterium]|nr:hypothetical protein [Thermoguttaceae bacterium]